MLFSTNTPRSSSSALRPEAAVLVMAIAVLCTAVAPLVGALPAPSMLRMGSVSAQQHENAFFCGAIDSSSQFAVFSTYTTPSKAVKFDLTVPFEDAWDSSASGLFSSDTAKSESDFFGCALDHNSEFFYAGTYTDPLHIVKFSVQPLARVAALTLAGMSLSRSFSIDSKNELAYVTGGGYNGVKRINLTSFTEDGSVLFPTGEGGYMMAATVDHNDQFAYFGNPGTPAYITRVSLSPFQWNASFQLPAGEVKVASAVMEPSGQHAFFSCITSPGKVIKVQLQPTFGRVAALTMQQGENKVLTGVVDSLGRFMYFGIYTGSPAIVKIDVASFARIQTVPLPASDGPPYTSVIDANDTFAYFGTEAAPGRLIKICLVDCGWHHWYNTDSRLCVVCPSSTYSNTTCSLSSATCIPCPAGHYCPTSGAAPKPCPVGSFSTATSATSPTTCQSCPAGEGNSVNGSTSCHPCPAGEHAESGVCLQCPSGTYSSAVGATSSATCQTVSAGHYASAGSGATSYSACDPGSWSDVGASQCTLCDAGTYQPNSAATSVAACLPTPAGTWSEQGAASPTNCTAGTYSNTTRATSSATCDTVPAGHFANAPSGANNYSACQPGSYSSARAARCTNCSGGYASSAVGATSITTCSICSANFYAPPGSPACIACPLFTTTDGKMGQSECRQLYTLGTTAPAPTTATFANTLPQEITAAPTPPPSPTTAADPVIAAFQAAASMSGVAQALSAASSPATSTTQIRLSIPYLGLGSFLTTARRCGDTLAQAVKITVGDGAAAVTLSSTDSAGLAAALTRCVALTPSPGALARNLTSSNLLGVELTVVGSSSSSSTIALPLEQTPLNLGPAVAQQQCSTEVPRGVRFRRELGFVFHHPLELPLTVDVAQADGFQIPPTVRVTANSSGFVSARGVLGTAAPLVMSLSATDGYHTVTSTCIITPVFMPLRFMGPPPAGIFSAHVGVSFSFDLPVLAMFEGSNSWIVASVTVGPDRYPLPSTVRFEASSNALIGTLSTVGIFNFTVTAADHFDEVDGWVLVQVTNEVPECNASALPSLIAKAREEHRLVVNLQLLCQDADVDDRLRFELQDTGSLPPWLHHSISGAGSTTPQLVLTCTPPVPGVSVDISIVARDSVSSSAPVAVRLVVPPNHPPRVVGPLVSGDGADNSSVIITMNPGETKTIERDNSALFVDPDGDKLSITVSVTPEAAAAWISRSAADGRVVIVAAPDDVDMDTTSFEPVDAVINVTAVDPFGASVSVNATIHLRLSLWQEVQLYVAIAGAIMSTILTVLGYLFLYPIFVNMYRSRSRTIEPCPLNAQNPQYDLAKEVALVEYLQPRDDLPLQCLRDCTRHISTYLWDLAVLNEFPQGDPPPWLAKESNYMRLEPEQCSSGANKPTADVPWKKVVVRIFDNKELLLARFVIDYETATRGWTFEDGEDDDDAPGGSRPQWQQQQQPQQQHHHTAHQLNVVEEQLRWELEQNKAETEGLKAQFAELVQSVRGGAQRRGIVLDDDDDATELETALIDHASHPPASLTSEQRGQPSRQQLMTFFLGDAVSNGGAAPAAEAEAGSDVSSPRNTTAFVIGAQPPAQPQPQQPQQQQKKRPKTTPTVDHSAWQVHGNSIHPDLL